MKKQVKKLNLNKRTISNLGTPEMTKIVGGGPTNGANCNPTPTKWCTRWCDSYNKCTLSCSSG